MSSFGVDKEYILAWFNHQETLLISSQWKLSSSPLKPQTNSVEISLSAKDLAKGRAVPLQRPIGIPLAASFAIFQVMLNA